MQGAYTALGSCDAEFEAVVLALMHGGLHRGHHAILVFGMQRVDEEVVIRAHIQRPAVNTIDLVRPPYLAGDEIEFPITHRGDALCLFQTMLTLHQRLLGRPCTTDIFFEDEIAVGFTFVVKQRGDRFSRPIMRSVLALAAYFAAPLTVHLQRLPHFGKMRGRRRLALQQLAVLAELLRCGVAGESDEAGIDVFDVTEQIGDGDGRGALLNRLRELMQARLARLSFDDIGETHHRSGHLVLLAYRCKTAFDLHGAAVAVPKHHLVPNVGALSLTCTDETIFRTYRAALRGMAVYQLVQGPAEELVGSIAQQAGAGIIDERAAAFAIHAVYTLGGGFEQQADVSVEFGVLRLHAVLRGDVGDESLEPLHGTALVPARDTLLPSQFFGAVLCAQAIMQAIRRTRGNRVLHFIPKTLAVVGVYQLHEAQMPIVLYVGGGISGEREAAVAHEFHGPVGIVATTIDHARQVPDQSGELALPFAQAVIEASEFAGAADRVASPVINAARGQTRRQQQRGPPAKRQQGQPGVGQHRAREHNGGARHERRRDHVMATATYTPHTNDGGGGRAAAGGGGGGGAAGGRRARQPGRGPAHRTAAWHLDVRPSNNAHKVSALAGRPSVSEARQTTSVDAEQASVVVVLVMSFLRLAGGPTRSRPSRTPPPRVRAAPRRARPRSARGCVPVLAVPRDKISQCRSCPRRAGARPCAARGRRRRA